MSDVATIEHTAAPATPQKKKKERISKRIKRACDLLASGECRTVKAAAERANLSRSHLSRTLGQPHIQAFIAQRARQTIAIGMLRASERAVELIDAASEHVAADMSKYNLACGGIRPPDQGGVTVNTNVSVGYVIRLDKPEASALSTHESAIEVKSLK